MLQSLEASKPTGDEETGSWAGVGQLACSALCPGSVPSEVLVGEVQGGYRLLEHMPQLFSIPLCLSLCLARSRYSINFDWPDRWDLAHISRSGSLHCGILYVLLMSWYVSNSATQRSLNYIKWSLVLIWIFLWFSQVCFSRHNLNCLQFKLLPYSVYVAREALTFC